MKPAQTRSRHGLNALMARVKVRGLAAIDGRTVAARALLDWRTDLVADLGGEAAISAQQRALVEVAARSKLYIDHVDAFLMEQRSLVNARRKAVLPVLRERQTLADSLARILSQLGLERRQAPAKSLQEVITEIQAGKAEADQPPRTAKVQASSRAGSDGAEVRPPGHTGAAGSSSQ
jgi:hypothetical protein